MHLLYPERHENGQRFGSQCAECFDFPYSERHGCFEPVQLLILQHSHLTQFPADDRKNLVRIIVQLLLGVCRMHKSKHSEHHSLVSCHKVIKELSGLLPLLLHIVRNHSREVVVHVLASLEIRNIGFHTEHPLLHLPHSLICRDRHDVYRHHHVTAESGKLSHHVVRDIRGVVTEEQRSSVSVSDHEVIAVILISVRTYIVTEVMSQLHMIIQIKAE